MTARSPCERTAPFLHRTWLKGVKALQSSSVMGNIISTPMQQLFQDEPGHHTKSAKRRRISSPDLFDIDQLVASPRMSEPASTLRIDILKLLHKDSKKVKSYQGTAPRDVLTSKARCKVTIFDTSAAGPPQVLHCQSQMCELTSFVNPNGPHRITRVEMSQPFFVPHDNILVNRPDDGGFDLSESYELVVELEAANSLHWPPLNAQDFGLPNETLYPSRGSTQHWILTSTFDSVVGRLKNPLHLSARYPADQSSVKTNYIMDIDLRWTAGFKALGKLDKGSKQCITAVDPDAAESDDASSTRGGLDATRYRHRVTTEYPIDHDNEFSVDQTPSRSLRTREKNKSYNLKVLSDQQLGRERKPRAPTIQDAASEGRVQYVLPAYQPVSLDFYRCITCGVYHESMDQLQLHLRTSHPMYEYVLQSSNDDGPLLRVSAHGDSASSPQKAHQLGRNVKPFHLQSVASGNPAWLTSRMGLGNDEPFRSPTKNAVGRTRTASPLKAHRICTRRPESKQSNNIVIPNISQPLFHPVSRARLKPGQDVPRIDADSDWLIHRHRESIKDFSDVTPAEKEYIWEWDGFVLRENVTSAAYFPQTWLKFIKAKATWLAGAEQRIRELAKHMSVLQARDALNDEHLQQAFRYINEARAKRRLQVLDEETRATSNLSPNDESTKHSPRASQICKGTNGCVICQLPVQGPRLLLCNNKACLKRIYHSDCIEHDATIPVTNPQWLCNDCARDTNASD
ncbi:hypothetical protein E4U17_000019 [Claviceps sp. LM77 group G4]|nr:hypothetical protein E4U17_000019 [Claviceps sp. LM77 group G4]